MLEPTGLEDTSSSVSRYHPPPSIKARVRFNYVVFRRQTGTVVSTVPRPSFVTRNWPRLVIPGCSLRGTDRTRCSSLAAGSNSIKPPPPAGNRFAIIFPIRLCGTPLLPNSLLLVSRWRFSMERDRLSASLQLLGTRTTDSWSLRGRGIMRTRRDSDGTSKFPAWEISGLSRRGPSRSWLESIAARALELRRHRESRLIRSSRRTLEQPSLGSHRRTYGPGKNV